MSVGRLLRLGGALALITALIVLEVMLLERPRTPTDPARPLRRTSEGGTLVDQESGLRWQRCLRGMRVRGARCVGRPVRTDHSSARSLCAALGAGWRLPTIEEQLGQSQCDPLDLAVCVSADSMGEERAGRCARDARRRSILFWGADPDPRDCIHPRRRVPARCASAVRAFRSACPFFEAERTLLVVDQRALFRCVNQTR